MGIPVAVVPCLLTPRPLCLIFHDIDSFEESGPVVSLNVRDVGPQSFLRLRSTPPVDDLELGPWRFFVDEEDKGQGFLCGTLLC